MKIKIASEKCQGHGRCYAIAPDIFQVDENGYLGPGEILVEPAQEEIAKRAVRACPERALTIEED